MKRIARFVPVPIVGGVGVSVLTYFRLLDHAKYPTDFFVQSALPSEIVREIESAGGRVVVLPPFSRPLSYLMRTVSELRNGHYDVVHSHMNTLSAFPLLAALIVRVPIRIAQAHATSSWREPLRHFSKLILRPLTKLLATRYAACSENAGRWQFGEKALRTGRVLIIHTAIDLDRFAFDAAKRVAIRTKLGFTDGEPVVGHVGRMCSVKNQLRLLSIFAQVKRHLPAARLLLVGGGAMLESVKAQANVLGLGESVVFAGETNGAADYYHAMDVFAFPSLYEGLGRSLIEAQTNGVRSVASTAVPSEAKVTNLVEFVPLELSDAFWAERLVAALRSPRGDCGSALQVAAAGYDVRQEVHRHAALYDLADKC